MKNNEISPPLYIVEGAESVWHYHLSTTGKTGGEAICGKRMMMHTEIPLRTWGKRSHIGESYCRKCDEIAHKNKIDIPMILPVGKDLNR